MTNKTRPFALASLLAAALLFPSTSAFADSITVTLNSPVQSGTANSTLSFSGTIAAAANNISTFYINGDSLNLFSATNPASLSLDDTAISNDINNFVTIDPGKSFSGLFFTVSLPSGIAASAYNGTFQVLGGSDFLATDVTSTANLQVNISGTSPVPEPGTWLLLATGLAIGTSAFYLNGKLNRSTSTIA